MFYIVFGVDKLLITLLLDIQFWWGFNQNEAFFKLPESGVKISQLNIFDMRLIFRVFFFHFQVEDTGNYMCKALNAIGETHVTAELRVQSEWK